MRPQTTYILWIIHAYYTCNTAPATYIYIYSNECGYTWRHIPFWVLDSPRYTSELPFGLCILWCYWALVQSWARYTFCIDFFLKLRTALRVSNLIAMAQIQFIIPYSITLLLHSRFYLPVNGNKKQYELLKHCS